MQQNSIIYLDIAAVVIMSISLASLLLRGLTKGAANRVYLTVMAMVTLTAILALGGEVYDVYVGPVIAEGGRIESDIGHVGRTSCAILYYALRSLMAPAYLVLIATISDTTHKLNDNNVVRFILWVPMIAMLVAIFTNPIHHLLFVFDHGILRHGPLLQAMYAEVIYYSVPGVLWLLKWRKLLSVNEFATLFLLYPIMLAAMVIQYNVPGLKLEMFVTSIALMLVSAFVIHPETRHDAEVDAASLSAYREMLTRAFATGKPLCLVYLEIVNMEGLRQLMGKLEMQTIIRAAADNLSKSLERDDVLYYLHNGVFCISPRNIDPAHALAIANRTHEEGKARSIARHDRIPVTEMRSCIVRVPEDVSDIETIKSFGKRFSHMAPQSCVTTYEELSKRDDFQMQIALTALIDNAIRDRSFEVHFQPIYCVHDGKYHSAEALVRLEDPKLGQIPPSLFIPEAEKSGLIIDIGSVLLEKVSAFLGSVDFAATGLDFVEANLSVDQCVRPELADELLGFMRTYGADPTRLNVEITETSSTYSQHAIEENVRVLAAAGVTLSLDDYGTGYSNMARMLALPFKLVKIDKSFIDALDDPAARVMLADTVSMLKNIGKQVLVEGAETEAQVEALKSMGVDYIQGYYYSMALPEDEFISFLIEHNS